MFEGDVLSLEVFGISPEDYTVDLVYEISATYDNPRGKFSLIFAESALVDCHYIFSGFIVGIEVKLEYFKDKYPEDYKKAIAVLNAINDWLS